MNIKAEYSYTVKEVNQLTGIHTRKLNRVAVENNIPKVDNKYVFSGSFLIDRFKLKEKDKMSEGVIPLSANVNISMQQEIKELRKALEVHHRTLESHQKLIQLLSKRINEGLE